MSLNSIGKGLQIGQPVLYDFLSGITIFGVDTTGEACIIFYDQRRGESHPVSREGEAVRGRRVDLAGTGNIFPIPQHSETQFSAVPGPARR